ncbi:ATP-binding cassette domain-containing protein [Candidatus Aerophobetes bacterium]|nr:ATP-binding cassette domain-containing protein [Candidatus Aerophobetes bacterium]
MSESSVIQVSNLKRVYGKTVAVDNVSFEVKKGEIFGFLGPNGAGKTTTIRMLTGVILPDPDEGEVKILGIDIKEDPISVKKIMGVVPELCNVYVDLSSWDNMILTGKIYGVKRKEREEKAEELLKKFGLWERREEKTRKFSKGMKQRLILAMSLIHEPKILFLDEPTSGLDVQSARMIRKIIEELRLKGKTIFLTTHNIEEANLLCDRIAIINKGKIVAIDSPEKLKSTFKRMQSVEVAFDRMPEDIKWCRSIPYVNECKELGDKFRVYTKDPDSLIKKLVNFAEKNNLKFISLNTLGPSLEDVFVALTEKVEAKYHE